MGGNPTAIHDFTNKVPGIPTQLKLVDRPACGAPGLPRWNLLGIVLLNQVVHGLPVVVVIGVEHPVLAFKLSIQVNASRGIALVALGSKLILLLLVLDGHEEYECPKENDANDDEHVLRTGVPLEAGPLMKTVSHEFLSFVLVGLLYHGLGGFAGIKNILLESVPGHHEFDTPYTLLPSQKDSLGEDQAAPPLPRLWMG